MSKKLVFELDGDDFSVWYWSKELGALCFTHAVQAVIKTFEVDARIAVLEEYRDYGPKCQICEGHITLKEE